MASKSDFLSNLKQAVKHSTAPKTERCRCADCSDGKQTRQDKTEDTSLK